jgi:hypothetical protein
MLDSHRRWITSRIFLTASVLLLTPALAKCQEAQNAAPSDVSSSSAELTSEVHALTDTVRELQSQVQSLQSQLTVLSAKEQGGGTRTHAAADVTEQESATPSQTAVPARGAVDPYSVLPAAEQSASESDSNVALTSAPADQTIEGRVSKLEDDQQLIDAKLTDQYQTKIESGSKYRVRLSGMVLVNLFENRGAFDNADFPEIATENSPFESDAAFGGSLRQSQIRLQVFGPDLWGAHTSGDIDFDFAGGFPDAPNGTVMGLPRFRTGTVRLDWANTSIVAGQDFLFFSPLQPTSLASVAVPPLSYSGNLWGWTPQVRIEHHVEFSDTSRLLLEAGILDSLTGDLPYSQYDRYPSWGEQSGQPAYAGRIAWSYRVLGQNMTVGEGAYYGRQFWGLDRHVNGWAATTDLTMPLGSQFTFTGSLYRGSGVGGLGGAIGQDILLSGSFTSPATTIQGIDSMGGWAQLKFKPRANFEINGAFGQDNPFASELRMFEATTPPLYGNDLLARNRSAFVNFIYQPKSNIMMSLEYLRLDTFDLDDSYSANQVNLALGYIF